MDRKDKEGLEQSINQAEIVPHPRNEHDVALFLHESYHLLSNEDHEQPDEEI